MKKELSGGGPPLAFFTGVTAGTMDDPHPGPRCDVPSGPFIMPEFENLEPYESREGSGKSRITPVAPHTLPASEYVPQSDSRRKARRRDAPTLQPAPTKITPIDSRDMERAFRKADRADRAQRRKRKGSLLQQLVARIRAFFKRRPTASKKPVVGSGERTQRNHSTNRRRTNPGTASSRQHRDEGPRRNRPTPAEGDESRTPRRARRRRSSSNSHSSDGQPSRKKPAQDPSAQTRDEGSATPTPRRNSKQNRPKSAPTHKPEADASPPQGDGQNPKRRRNRNRRNRGSSGGQQRPGHNHDSSGPKAPQS